MAINKIILGIIATCSMVPPARAATTDAAYALMDKIESFEEKRNRDTTPEVVADFYAEVSAEVLKLPEEALQLIRRMCKDPAYLIFFPDIENFFYSSFCLSIKYALRPGDIKFIIIDTNVKNQGNDSIYALIVEGANTQKFFYVVGGWEHRLHSSREKSGSFSDFIMYVLKRQEEWIKNDPISWSGTDY